MGRVTGPTIPQNKVGALTKFERMNKADGMPLNADWQELPTEGLLHGYVRHRRDRGFRDLRLDRDAMMLVLRVAASGIGVAEHRGMVAERKDNDTVKLSLPTPDGAQIELVHVPLNFLVSSVRVRLAEPRDLVQVEEEVIPEVPEDPDEVKQEAGDGESSGDVQPEEPTLPDS